MALRRAAALGALLAGLASPAAAQGLSVRRLVMPDDVPAHLCSALAQDGDGFLWLGTQAGLVRYDGYEFRVLRSDEADDRTLGGSYVRTLLAARDGRLWVGTFSGGLSVYDPRSEAFARYRHDAADRHSLGHDRVEGLAEDARGHLWVATNEGLDKLDPATGAFAHFRHAADDPDSLADDRVRGLLVDRAGRLWVGTRDGLQRREPGRFVRVASERGVKDSLAGQYVNKIVEDARGRLWIGTTEHGAAVLDPATGALQRLSGLGHFWVAGFAEVGPREMWVATFGGGVDVVDTETLAVAARLRHDATLPSTIGGDRVGALLRDRAGLVWIGTWGQGVARHDPAVRAFEAVRHSPARPDGLSHPAVVRPLAAKDGTRWAGTDGNGVDVLDAAGRRVGAHRAGPDGLGGASVTCLAEGPEGSKWVATLNGVLHRLRPGAARFERWTAAEGLPGGPIRALTFGPDGTLWTGSSEGLGRLDPRTGRASAYRHRPADPASLSGHAVESIAFTPDGTLWVGTDSGLNVVDPATGQARRILHDPGRADSLPNNWVPDLMVAGDGRLWVATQAGAAVLTAWDGRQAAFLRVAARLQRPAAPVDSLIEDAQGQVWLGSRLRVDPRTWTAREFGPADGHEFRTMFIASRSRAGDGTLLFGSPEGLLMVHPERLQPWSYAPPLVATGLQAAGARRAGASRLSELRLESAASALRLDFAALDFTAPERLAYRYRLEGLEDQWTAADAAHRSATFSSLPPGRYTLRVEASNRVGAWSGAGLALPLVVRPAFHQTAWFRVLAVLALGLLAFSAFRLRVRRLEGQKRELEALVARRTEDLRQANEELARRNVSLSEHVRLQEDVERMSRHDLRTPLAGILSLVKLLRRTPALPARALELLDMVERAGYRVLDLVNLSLDLLRMEKGTYRLRPASVDLVEVARRIAADLRHHAASKRVAFRLRRDGLEAAAPCRAWGEELLSYSMLANLMKNALEAAPEGSEVAVDFEQAGAEVAVRVSNPGAVPLALRERFFEKYGTSGKEGGTGLGTYSARLLAETQRGRISLATSEAAGTTVAVVLPAAPAPAAGDEERKHAPPAPAPASWPPLRVLLVDDDPFHTAVLQESLPQPPLVVERAANGRAGLERAQALDPDVVFMDAEMPVMGGLEAVARLREREAATGRRTFVVGITAHDAAAHERFLEAGCDRCLTKPCEPEAVQAVLAEAARQLGAEAGSPREARA